MGAGGILLLTAILGLIVFTIAKKRSQRRNGDPSGPSGPASKTKGGDDHDGDGNGGDGDGGGDGGAG